VLSASIVQVTWSLPVYSIVINIDFVQIFLKFILFFTFSFPGGIRELSGLIQQTLPSGRITGEPKGTVARVTLPSGRITGEPKGTVARETLPSGLITG
jgi:hypothetical protein